MNQVDYEINKELGECYLFMGEYDKARDYYQKAVGFNKQASDPYMGLAAIAVQKSELQDALSLYSKAHQLNPSEKPLTGMAMIEMELGRHAEAFEHFKTVLDVNPGNMMVVNCFLQLGYALSKLEETVPYLERALEPGDAEAVRYALAACLLTLGRDEEAKNHLELLLGENPSNDGAKQLYAQIAA